MQITILIAGLLSSLFFSLPCAAGTPAGPETGTVSPVADSMTVQTGPDTSATFTPAGDASQTQNDTIATTAVQPPAASPPGRTASPAPAVDSAAIIYRKDSLLTEESARRRLFYPDHATSIDRTNVTADDLFRADATSWNDVPELKRRAIVPRMGIANSFNRLLFYGNTAPLTRQYHGTDLLYRTACNPLYGDDANFTTEYGIVDVAQDGALYCRPHTRGLIAPETAIFWETGVFDENILSLRFTRYLSRRLALNVFSNYRYLKGMPFSHDGNDVYTFFSKVTPDTTLLSHKGYNPLVNEFFCGADALYTGMAASSFVRIKYGDLTNELSINRTPAGTTLDHTRLMQYPLTLQSGFSTHRRSPLFLNAEVNYASNPQKWTRAVTAGTTSSPQTIRFATADWLGALRTGMTFWKQDSVALQCSVNRHQAKVADSLDFVAFSIRPELDWGHPFGFCRFTGKSVLKAGYEIYSSESTVVHAPVWSGRLQTSLFDFHIGLYAEQDNLHYQPFFDSCATSRMIHDSYFRTGVEIEHARQWFALLLGYQWCTAVDNSGVNRAWLSGTAPYPQPQSVFIIAPEIGRWHGTLLSTRLMLSDKRPYVKMQGTLSLLAFPKLTHEAIDVRIGLDYWSERDYIVFAGITDWNRPVFDCNIAASIHIKSFRFVYKIDNLLNRNFSYIPGYYSPGITFRWGFSWFIQR